MALLALPAAQVQRPGPAPLEPKPARLSVSLSVAGGSLSATDPAAKSVDATEPSPSTSRAQARASEGKAAQAETGLPLPAGLDAEGEYLPRNELFVPAHPVSLVRVDYPDSVLVPGRVRVVLVLFIDETGAVRRTRVEDESQAPAALVEAAKAAFMSARFSPAQRDDGSPAKSRMRIEVSFDAR